MMGIRRGSTVMGIVIALCGQLFAAESTNAIKPNLKVLLCTGDYGMFGQDRAKLISESVTKAATGAVVEIEQSFNFVKKLEAPGYAERFDAIVAGDIALGQMTTRAQQALVRFVAGGGGFIYVVAAKSTIGFAGVAEIEPNPLKEILPYAWPEANPVKGARPDARKLLCTDAFFAGFDFAKTPWLTPDKDGKVPERGPLALERDEGKGRVLSLYSAFGADYAGPSHSKKIVPGGWQDWGQFGDFWFRLLDRVSAGSPVRAMTRAESDGKAFHEVPCTATVAVDAGKPVDEVRASDFSIVALQQLYNEDGGGNEALFFELNPRDWFDRRSGEVFENKAGKAFPDGKGPLFEQFNIKGILMGHNSYGSYYVWTEKDYLNGVSNGWVKTSDTNKPWLATYDAYVKKMNEDYQVEVAQHTAIAKKYPKFCTYFQPGNEPPCDDNYFAFHNKISGDILKQVPDMKIIGPNKAFNISAVDVKEMTAFVEKCGAKTDVLNWHIYARCPDSVREEVKYWSKYSEGKLRSPGPGRVMFTESDAWNTRESQFNYLVDRAFTFLPMKEIVACFQYCMDSRNEGGPYHFGILQPKGEFSANYNGYWIFRNLRGKLVESQVAVTPAAAAEHCRVLASSADDGRSVTVVAYYDTGFWDGATKSKAGKATFNIAVNLPSGKYTVSQCRADWSTRDVMNMQPGTVSGTAKAVVVLEPCTAVAYTWSRVP